MPCRFFWPVTWVALWLTLLPGLLWMANWQWQPNQALDLLYPFYLITETVTRPWGAITTILLFVWFFCLFRRAGGPWVSGLILTALIVFTGQVSVNYIKPHAQETRPYRVWLNQQDAETKTSQQVVNQNHKASKLYRHPSPSIPTWQRHHWQQESRFSFPSGHSMFASCWVLLAVAFFWQRGFYLSCLIILMWAMLVTSSRMLLGMHWPWDVIASTFIAWCLVIVVLSLAARRRNEGNSLG